MFDRLWSWIKKLPEQPVPAAERPPPVITVYVAMSAAKLPSAEDVIANYTTLLPTGPTPGTPLVDETKILLPLSNGAKVVIIMMSLPMPWEELKASCEVSAWPKATDALRDHQAHLIVTVLGLRGQPIERHLTMTRIAAAVAAATPVLGIIWEGFLVHEPRAFQELAARTSVNDLVPQLWIGMRVNDNEDGSFTFLTAGMDVFGLMEIEIDSRDESQQLANFGHGLVQYLLKRGVPIPEGETIGRTVEERIAVAHAPGRWAPGTVMKLRVQ